MTLVRCVCVKFASNAKTITNKPHVTEVLDDKAKMKQLQKLLKERDVDREKVDIFIYLQVI